MDMGRAPGSIGPLEPNSVDFANQTQASDFLGALLNDDELKVIGNAHARYFWYGMAVVVVIATLSNLTHRLILRARSVKVSSRRR